MVTSAYETGSSYCLALETSSALGGVALGRGRDLIEARSFTEVRRHARDLISIVDALCRDHSVEPAMIRAVYLSRGPGSFTGLRIAATAARMISLACAAKLVAVPTLEVIAQNGAAAATPPDQLAVILDAKRQRVYAAPFVRRGGCYQATDEAVEVDPGEFLSRQDRSCAIMGEGVRYHRAAVERSGLTVLPETLFAPRVEQVFRLGVLRARQGLFEDRRSLVPLYVRPPEAVEKWAEREAAKRIRRNRAAGL